MSDQMTSPSNLQLMLLSDPDPNADEPVFFMVNGCAASEVAAAVVREFQSQGFQVRPINETQAIATSGATEIHVTIHGLRTNIAESGAAGLSSEALDSVVVELSA